jgi:2',3'-cyclic-nucleotide 2'-phosphodiesterase (5'-nucleotidase family)
VERLRSEGKPLLLVDSGDLFFDRWAAGGDRERALAKARLISRIYKRLGETAINVGDLDLILGLGFLRQEASEGLPLISANLLDPAEQKPVFPPYVIREVSGLKIAFFGLLSKDFGPQIPKTVKDQILVKDPSETAREMVPKLRAQADLVVLLSDLGLDGDRELVKAASGIDFVLGGHDGRYIKWPDQENGTYIVQSYKKGMYLGQLTLTFEKPGLPFQDLGKKEQIELQIHNLERRISALQEIQKRKPNPGIDRTIQSVTGEKEERQRELDRLGATSASGNRFTWAFIRLDGTLKEDQEVRGWIKAAGIESD